MGNQMNTSLYFVGPDSVEVREEAIPVIAPNQALVQTLFSAISAGTEMLIYRQQISLSQPIDLNIQALSGKFQFPMKYGYSVVGKIVAAGTEISSSWIGKTIFSFHPHESLFSVNLNEIMEIPGGISPQDALFLPNMETAVNFVMDGRPVLGEKVVVWGQGIVGLLTTSILAQFPLENLVTLDLYPLRRHMSQKMGAQNSFDPQSRESLPKMKSIFQNESSSGADLIFETSGNPEALDSAIEIAGYDGRIIVGSWYGTKEVKLNLGEGYHRNRVRLVSSQVSTVAPHFQGRWTKSRRFQTVWNMIEKIKPSQFITHQFPLSRAAEAYKLLDENPGEAIQVIFSYEDCGKCINWP